MGLKEAQQVVDGLRDWGLRDSDFPDCFGEFSGRLLICGAGRCLWDDLEALGCASPKGRGQVRFDGDMMVVNETGQHFPGDFRHWYSNSARELALWSQLRRAEVLAEVDPAKPVLTHSVNYGVKYRWPWPGHGNSGLNAVYTGLGLGYEEIILAGLPNDDSGHYFDPPWRRTNFSREGGDPVKLWTKAKSKCFHGRVKSMSGMTREILGAPHIGRRGA